MDGRCGRIGSEPAGNGHNLTEKRIDMKNWMLTALMALVVVAMGSPWALAQDAPVQEAPVAEAVPVEAPAEAPAETEQDAVAAVMEAVQDAIEDAIADAAPAAVPEAVEADPEPMTLADVYGDLNGAIQSAAGTGAEVGLAPKHWPKRSECWPRHRRRTARRWAHRGTPTPTFGRRPRGSWTI